MERVFPRPAMGGSLVLAMASECHRKVLVGKDSTEEDLAAVGYWKLNSRFWGAILFIIMLAGLASGRPSNWISRRNKSPKRTKARRFRKQSNKDQRKTGDSSSPGLGWGSSIEVARQAHAAEDALKGETTLPPLPSLNRRRRPLHKTRIFGSYPDTRLRMAGRYQVSVDAYKRGLQDRPNSAQGLGGLAQTYAKMGRDEEARQLFLKLAAANPKDAGALQLAGEFSMNSDPQVAVDLLRRLGISSLLREPTC